MAVTPPVARADRTFPSYTGRCSICRYRGEFHFTNERSVREDYRCPQCRFALRWRDQASLIIDEFGNGQSLSIVDLVNGGFLDNVAIYEPALRGPFEAQFQSLPDYTRSYFWPDRARGSIGEEGVRNEDLTRLTFPDDSFDLILTSDVMEHLLNIDAAFAEITRVLKPGGVHIFTIPTSYPLPDETVARVVEKDGEEVNVLPAIYHYAGDGSPCLVYHDYGADLAARIDRHGSRTRIVRRSGELEPCVHNATFITRKLDTAEAVTASARAAAMAAQTRNPAKAKAKAGAGAGDAPQCPICGSRQFEDFAGRPNARCSRCRCVERQRLMWMVVERLELATKGLRVLHIAPEKVMADKFRKALGATHTPYAPEGGEDAVAGAVGGVDLATVPDGSFDVILHNHVIDKVTRDVSGLLRELRRVLAPGGHHLMSEPLRGAPPAAAAPGEPATAHAASRPDIMQLLDEIWGAGPNYFLCPLSLFDEEELKRHMIPRQAWSARPSSQGIFYNRAPELAPRARQVVRPAASSADGIAPRPASATFAVSSLTTGIATGRLTNRREETAAFILRHFAPAAHYRRLVDLGAGSCAFSRIAASLGHEVTAIDRRPPRKAGDLGDIVLREEDVRDTDFSHFDAVLVLGLLYHLAPADQVELLKRCPPGSVAIIDTQIFVERVPGLFDMLGDRISIVQTDVLGRYDGVFLRADETPTGAIDTEDGFVPSEPSLLRMLEDTGFRSVVKVDPIYYTTAGARRWYVALK